MQRIPFLKTLVVGVLVALGASTARAQGQGCNIGNTYRAVNNNVPRVRINDQKAQWLINLVSHATLFRDMDPSGMNNFRGWINKSGYNGLVESGAAMVTGSAEWARNQCQQYDTQSIVTNLVASLLRRYPTNEEQFRYGSAIERGGMANVVREVLSSNEFYAIEIAQ